MAIELGWSRQQAVLAVLLTHINQPISVDALIEAVWADSAPQGARNTVQTNISRLRRILRPTGAGEEVVVRTEAGYLLRGTPEQLDVLVFQRELRVAQEHQGAGRSDQAATAVDAALRCWRGEPFSGLESPFLQAQRLRLQELRLQAQELWAALSLERGDHQAVVAELTALAAHNPLRERLRELLMMALFRSGRQAEALEVFHDTQTTLSEALGIDPGQALRAIHRRILAEDLVLASAPRQFDPLVTTTPPAAPEPLPADVPAFTGRDAELRRLTEPGAQQAAEVHVIDGMPGIGKTALAVHAAHRLAPDYPDGRFFLRLNAFADGEAPLHPREALAGLLSAVGVPAESIPAGLPARSALWRNVSRGRRILLLLDDAADHEQIRPLLPGPGRSRVLITSRRRLTALENLCTTELGPLSRGEAGLLLQRLLGQRAQADPASVCDLMSLCGRLPLAITLLAGRLRHHPQWTIRYLADLLASSPARLGELRAENRTLTAAFEMSYRELPTEHQPLFRCLGLIPGNEIDAATAAALTGLPPDSARRALEQLYDNHLLSECAPGRYVLHDLVKEYAMT
ncbi:winged helix-turn-helix domain-containing protein, partial [Crossiella sp. SN42]|uniref:AfsR/SARP family transcriptional regulator n=1 Tax=Crossiella sp. SN42 TaxID=2944808 RepID=UPI00207C443F